MSNTDIPCVMSMHAKVVVVTGVGGIGLPIARRLAVGRHLIIADNSPKRLLEAVSLLIEECPNIEPVHLDVSDRQSVDALVEHASKAGDIEAIVHAAGVGAIQASPSRIYQVNLLGTANVIDAFSKVASAATSFICISSMAGYTAPTLSEQFQQHLATAPVNDLLSHPEIQKEGTVTCRDANGRHARSKRAYGISKYGNHLRVQAAAQSWGRKGARINSISPGLVATDMLKQEMEGMLGPEFRAMVESSAAQRVGTPDDVANAAAFLASPQASFITGTDLIVDGGMLPALRWA